MNTIHQLIRVFYLLFSLLQSTWFLFGLILVTEPTDYLLPRKCGLQGEKANEVGGKEVCFFYEGSKDQFLDIKKETKCLLFWAVLQDLPVIDCSLGSTANLMCLMFKGFYVAFIFFVSFRIFLGSFTSPSIIILTWPVLWIPQSPLCTCCGQNLHVQSEAGDASAICTVLWRGRKTYYWITSPKIGLPEL